MDKRRIQNLISSTQSNKIVTHVVPSHLTGMDRKKAIQEFARVADKPGSKGALVLIAVPSDKL